MSLLSAVEMAQGAAAAKQVTPEEEANHNFGKLTWDIQADVILDQQQAVLRGKTSWTGVLSWRKTAWRGVTRRRVLHHLKALYTFKGFNFSWKFEAHKKDRLNQRAVYTMKSRLAYTG